MKMYIAIVQERKKYNIWESCDANLFIRNSSIGHVCCSVNSSFSRCCCLCVGGRSSPIATISLCRRSLLATPISAAPFCRWLSSWSRLHGSLQGSCQLQRWRAIRREHDSHLFFIIDILLIFFSHVEQLFSAGNGIGLGARDSHGVGSFFTAREAHRYLDQRKS